MITGLEKVLRNPEDFQGKRVGLIANPTSITPDYQHALDAMQARGAESTKVFGPEHGVRGAEQAGEEPETVVDPKNRGNPFRKPVWKKAGRNGFPLSRGGCPRL